MIPELERRCFPIKLKIISNQIIFQFFQIMWRDRFFHMMIRKVKVFPIPRFPAMIQQTVLAIV